MEGKQRGEPKEEMLWEDLENALLRADRRKAAYGLRVHRSMKKSIFLLLEAAGMEPTHKLAEDLIGCVYLRAGLIRDSRYWQEGFGIDKEYETIDYTGKEGIRLSQSSTNEAVVSRRLAAPPCAVLLANSGPISPHHTRLSACHMAPSLFIYLASAIIISLKRPDVR